METIFPGNLEGFLTMINPQFNLAARAVPNIFVNIKVV
jgi:hypothetical protein